MGRHFSQTEGGKRYGKGNVGSLNWGVDSEEDDSFDSPAKEPEDDLIGPVLEAPLKEEDLNRDTDTLYSGAVAYRPAGSVSRSRSDEITRNHAREIANRKKNKGRSGSKLWIVVLVIVLLLGAGGGVGAYFFLRNTSVKVTLNGQEIATRPDMTLEQLLVEHPVSYAPGNLLSVSGNVIGEGGGETLTASINGGQTDSAEAMSHVMVTGDEVVLSDGADVVEAYEAVPVVIEPKLVIEGDSYALSYVAQWGRQGITETRTGSVSGEVVQVVTQELQDCVVVHRRPQPEGGEKIVALTFDDGPSGYTQRYLDILSAYGVHATFFCLGTEVQDMPDLLGAITAQGSLVASHTYSHNTPLNDLDTEDFRNELTAAFDAIVAAGAPATSYIRPPYGEFSDENWLDTAGLVTASIRWTEDSLDWKKPGVDAIVSSSCGDVNPGSIILMHDGGGDREQDLEALPLIIERLQSEGYRFVTIEELFASDPLIPRDIISGSAKMPEWAVWPTEMAGAEVVEEEE